MQPVGAWAAVGSPFCSVEVVPHEHEATWASAMATVLARVDAADSEEELDVALLWLLFLPQALLRQPLRGGRQGRGDFAARFALVSQGNWGGLVGLWERDVKKLEDKKAQQAER